MKTVIIEIVRALTQNAQALHRIETECGTLLRYVRIEAVDQGDEGFDDGLPFI